VNLRRLPGARRILSDGLHKTTANRPHSNRNVGNCTRDCDRLRVMFGVARPADEGAAAHLWQLLMAGQVPIIAVFALKWLPLETRRALFVLAVQIAAAWLRCSRSSQGLTMIHAQRGVGKTYVALAAGIAVASGGTFLPRGLTGI